MNAEEIIRFIHDAKKKTPVKNSLCSVKNSENAASKPTYGAV